MAAAACTTTALAASSSSLGMEGLTSRIRDRTDMPRRASVVVRAAAKDEERKGQGPEEPEKKSLFTSLTDALDFAAVRSDKDAELLQDASSATKSGERMSREQVRHAL